MILVKYLRKKLIIRNHGVITCQKKCVVCSKKRGKKNNKLNRISDKSITDAYIQTSVLIPFGSRVCKIHLDEYGFLKKSCLGK
jgi:hypothetical protein